MAHKKSTILLKDYLKAQGFEDLVNDILIFEYEENEKIGQELAKERKTQNIINSKGRLSPVYAAYHAYFNRKLAILDKLAVTITGRNKLKEQPKPDAIQTEIEAFMNAPMRKVS